MNNKYSVACITLVRDKYTLHFVRRCYGLRGIYGRFDSKSNRTADSIRDSFRMQKNDSQLPNSYHHNLFCSICCSTKIMSTLPSHSLNSLFETICIYTITVSKSITALALLFAAISVDLLLHVDGCSCDVWQRSLLCHSVLTGCQ